MLCWDWDGRCPSRQKSVWMLSLFRWVRRWHHKSYFTASTWRVINVTQTFIKCTPSLIKKRQRDQKKPCSMFKVWMFFLWWMVWYIKQQKWTTSFSFSMRLIFVYHYQNHSSWLFIDFYCSSQLWKLMKSLRNLTIKDNGMFFFLNDGQKQWRTRRKERYIRVTILELK